MRKSTHEEDDGQLIRNLSSQESDRRKAVDDLTENLRKELWQLQANLRDKLPSRRDPLTGELLGNPVTETTPSDLVGLKGKGDCCECFQCGVIAGEKEGEDRGFLRKDKEIRAIMDAATIVMSERGSKVKGKLDIDKLLEENKAKAGNFWKAIDLIVSAFKSDDMYFQPDWDKRRDTNKTLKIMTSVHTQLKLVRVVTKSRGPPVTELAYDINGMSSLKAVLPERGDDLDLTGFKGAVLVFEFEQLTELDSQRLDKVKSWSVHETEMLSLFAALGETGEQMMLNVCGSKDDPLFQDFVQHRDIIKLSARLALLDTLKLLNHKGEISVNPQTDIKLRAFRSASGGLDRSMSQNLYGIKEIGELKQKSNIAIKDYEGVHDLVKEFLNEVKAKFFWSSEVSEHVDQVREWMVDDLKTLREIVSKYWNAEEEKVNKQAQDKEQKAKIEAAEAEKRKEEAEEKKREAEAKERAAAAKEKEAEERKLAAEKSEREAMANANQRQQEANKAEEKAREQEEKAKVAEQRAQTIEEQAKAKEERLAAELARSKATRWRMETQYRGDLQKKDREIKLKDESLRAAAAQQEQLVEQKQNLEREKEEAINQMELACRDATAAEEKKREAAQQCAQRVKEADKRADEAQRKLKSIQEYLESSKKEGTDDNPVLRTLQGML